MLLTLGSRDMGRHDLKHVVLTPNEFMSKTPFVKWLYFCTQLFPLWPFSNITNSHLHGSNIHSPQPSNHGYHMRDLWQQTKKTSFFFGSCLKVVILQPDLVQVKPPLGFSAIIMLVSLCFNHENVKHHSVQTRNFGGIKDIS